MTGSSVIQFMASSSNPTTTPQEGTDYVYWNSYSITAGNQTRLVSAPINTSSASNVGISFYWYAENNTSYNSGVYLSEGVQVQYSTDGAQHGQI